MTFPLRAISTAIGVLWFCGVVALIGAPAMNGTGLAQPSPSGSGSPSGSPSPSPSTTTTHRDPLPVFSQIDRPHHMAKIRTGRLRVFRGRASESGATIRLALLQRTKSGDCFWRHRSRWVADGCREVRSHLVLKAAGTKRWSYELPWRLRPTRGDIRFYTLFSFADRQGIKENFETGRNRNRFEVSR